MEENKNWKDQETYYKLDRENKDLKERLKRLTKVFMRALVMLKYLARAGAIVGAFLWLGEAPAIALTGFIVTVAIIQLGIDKVQQSFHPEWDISEWDP